ncbi:MAG: hypothetical protein CR954_00365 [Candidatus Moraniibacteriota bacterium]|nr:MAG: hypothetical protein CR954_00365 [Candidatus Moranbacteria bacterium]
MFPHIAKKTHTKNGSELRYDLLRDEWVIIAAHRAKRPSDFIEDTPKPVYNEETDVFADPEKTGQEDDVLVYRDHNGAWTTRVFPNKYPVTDVDEDMKDFSEGPYQSMRACGHHEVLVTRDGRRTFAMLAIHELAEVIDAYRDRYLDLMSDTGMSSVTIFHNHGPKAGASIIHPHSQIIALPIVTPAVMREVAVCQKHAHAHKEHLFDMMTEYEVERGSRIVHTNEKFVVYCPFASSRAFQMRIVPRQSQPYFERIAPQEELLLADALSHALKALHGTLDDPDFNFYIRTAPCDGQAYDAYCFHIDIFPRVNIHAGFEFATDIEVVPVAPEDAAQYLRDALA